MAAKHGGKRPGAGRPAGARNRATVEQKRTLTEMAQDHTAIALAALVEVAKTGSDAARVSAANALLDRGYGKPRQEVDHSSTDGTMTPITGFDIRIAGAAPGDADAAAG